MDDRSAKNIKPANIAKLQKRVVQQLPQIPTKAVFDQIIQSKKLVVVDFTATWCGPCQQIAPKFLQLGQLMGTDAILMKVDVDENKEASEACQITCMPTFQFFKNGQKLHEIKGGNFDGVK